MNLKDRLAKHVLILRCQMGDNKAFAELIEKYHRPLSYFLTHLSDSAEMAEDLLQDTWVNAIRKIRTLRNFDAFPSWLYRIARNAAYQQLRRKKASKLNENIIVSEETTNDAFSVEDAARIHQIKNLLCETHPKKENGGKPRPSAEHRSNVGSGHRDKRDGSRQADEACHGNKLASLGRVLRHCGYHGGCLGIP